MHKKGQYFSKSYKHFTGNVKIEVDLSNYETKADLKRATWFDTSNLTKKSD